MGRRIKKIKTDRRQTLIIVQDQPVVQGCEIGHSIPKGTVLQQSVNHKSHCEV